MSQSTYVGTTQSCPFCQSESLEEYELSDFVHEDQYEIDRTLELSYEQALHMLKHDFGPIFTDRRGRRVWFNGLDEVVQCGMITAKTRPIKDKEEFINTMPKGKWSDYWKKSLLRDGSGVAEVKQMNRDETSAVRRSVSEYRYGRDRTASSQSTEATTETLAISADDRDRRKDSARSVEEDLTKSFQSAPPHRLWSSPGDGVVVNSEGVRRYYYRKAHDKIVFFDSRTTAKRVFTAIELNWHGSKYRVSPTLRELLAEWGEDNIVVHPYPLLSEGPISSTLSKASPLNH